MTAPNTDAPARARETINFKMMALGPIAGLLLALVLPESLSMPGPRAFMALSPDLQDFLMLLRSMS